MPQLGREIKRRLKSIASTKKITKAMELVAASKMRKAVGNVLSTRSYSGSAWELVRRLATKADPSWHPLLGGKLTNNLSTKKSAEKIALLLITSNRGLCGSFNVQVSQTALQYIAKAASVGQEVEIITLGKKGAEIVARQQQKLVADFKKLDVTVSVAEIKSVSQMLIDGFLTGTYSQIVLVYTDFISSLRQVPRVKQLLPLALAADQHLGSVDKSAVNQVAEQFEYLFEPAPAQVLAELLPRLLEIQIFQAVLESDASEHSARMMSMRNASDAATDMIADLTLAFNRARQASITAELADISAGAAGLE